MFIMKGHPYINDKSLISIDQAVLSKKLNNKIQTYKVYDKYDLSNIKLVTHIYVITYNDKHVYMLNGEPIYDLEKVYYTLDDALKDCIAGCSVLEYNLEYYSSIG